MTYELEEICQDGHWVWVEATAIAFYDPDGILTGYHGVTRDITERKKAEQALKGSEEKLILLIKNSNDIFVLVNETGEQFFVSDACLSLTGYTAEELKGPIANVIYPDDLEIVQQHWKEVVTNKNQSYRVQYRHKHKEKGFVWLEAVSQNFLDHPTINAVVSNIRDITTNKESELKLKESDNQLREINSTKDKLFSIIAHDLKSPFTSILGFSELLNENIRTYDIEKTEKFIAQIYSGSKFCLALLENLLDWAKTQTGQIDFKPEKLKLQPIIKEVVDTLDSSAKIKGISLNHFQSDDIDVFADTNMLKTILRNLISNAIKFTNTGGKISIYIISYQGQIEFTVSDNGVGMDKETINKLFQIGTNYTIPGTANEKGSGLGLILCKEFLEKHGERIWVESELRKRSEFKFTLPIIH